MDSPETFTLTQRTGQPRTVTLDAHGGELVCRTPDQEERLTPKRAWWLADVTDAMIGSGAILSGGGSFVEALRDFARDHADMAIDEVSDRE